MIDYIYEEIIKALAEFHMKTGEPATNIYLGRSEMKRLNQWAKEIQCVSVGDMMAAENKVLKNYKGREELDGIIDQILGFC